MGRSKDELIAELMHATDLNASDIRLLLVALIGTMKAELDRKKVFDMPGLGMLFLSPPTPGLGPSGAPITPLAGNVNTIYGMPLDGVTQLYLRPGSINPGGRLAYYELGYLGTNGNWNQLSRSGQGEGVAQKVDEIGGSAVGIRLQDISIFTSTSFEREGDVDGVDITHTRRESCDVDIEGSEE